MYNYKAFLVRVIDGDTVVLKLDLGFYLTREAASYRLLRIDAPENNTDEGKKAKTALEVQLDGKQLIAWTQKSDSFGRYLVELYADNKNISDWLVENNYANYHTY